MTKNSLLLFYCLISKSKVFTITQYNLSFVQEEILGYLLKIKSQFNLNIEISVQQNVKMTCCTSIYLYVYTHKCINIHKQYM